MEIDKTPLNTMKNSTCSPFFAFIAKGCAFIANAFITNGLAITSYISVFATYNQGCSSPSSDPEAFKVSPGGKEAFLYNGNL